jgi:hypothetical protein
VSNARARARERDVDKFFSWNLFRKMREGKKKHNLYTVLEKIFYAIVYIHSLFILLNSTERNKFHFRNKCYYNATARNASKNRAREREREKC